MTPGECHLCRSPVLLHRLPEEGRAFWRAPVVQFDTIAADVFVEEAFRVEAFAEGPQGNGLVLGLLPTGELAAVRPSPDGSGAVVARTSTEWAGSAYIHHAVSCSAEAARSPRPPGDAGTCRGCGQAVRWIVTPSGKRAPLDPGPHTGVRLSSAEARAAVRERGYVVGLTRRGEQARIREGGQMTLGCLLSETVTVYVNHFATCPRRADFVRPHDAPRG